MMASGHIDDRRLQLKVLLASSFNPTKPRAPQQTTSLLTKMKGKCDDCISVKDGVPGAGKLTKQFSNMLILSKKVKHHTHKKGTPHQLDDIQQ
jgi:hypothetical protein